MGYLLLVRGLIGVVPPFVWKILAVVAIALAIFFAGEVRGKRIVREQWAAAVAASKDAATAQDLQAEKEGRSQDLEITNQLIEQKKVDDAKIEELKSRLAKNSCAYDDNSLDPDERDAGGVRDHRKVHP